MEQIASSINSIANYDVYNNISQLVDIDKNIASAVFSELLCWACEPQNIPSIEAARNLLLQLPKEFLEEKTKETVLKHIVDISDDWEYRRLLEFCELVSIDLLNWSLDLPIDITRVSNIDDIQECITDFRAVATKMSNNQ